MDKTITVVIPTYSRSSGLARTIKSILAAGFNKEEHELLVMDDCSPDNTEQVVRSFEGEGVYYHRNEKNSGPAYSRNRGIEKAQGTIIVFTDDDCVVAKDWIAKIIESHILNNDDLAIGGKVLGLDDHAISRFRTFQIWHGMRKNRIGRRHFRYIPACNMTYKRDAFRKVGMFDEDFPGPSGEDVEFNNRFARIGRPVLFDPKIVVYHDHKDSMQDFLRRSYGYGFYAPLIKQTIPESGLLMPEGVIGTLKFLLAPFYTVIEKILLSEDYFIIPHIIIDEIAYRIGIIRKRINI